MRRRPFLRTFALSIALSVSAAGCSPGDGTGPDATLLHIRLLDDSGQPAGRHQVVIAPESGASLSRVSGRDGTLDVALSGAGRYRVTVIPRAGFVSTPALIRQVQVAARTSASVEFTIQRAGVSSGDGFYPTS